MDLENYSPSFSGGIFLGIANSVYLQAFVIQKGYNASGLGQLEIILCDWKSQGGAGVYGSCQAYLLLFAVSQFPFVKHNRLRRSIEDGYTPFRACFWIHQGSNYRHALLNNLWDCVTGDIVGVEGLGLEGKEDGHPSVFVRIVKYYATILPYAVVVPPVTAIPLVHMYIMDPISRLETEVFVTLILLWPPSLAKGIDFAVFHGNCFLYIFMEKLIEVVIRSRKVGRQQFHLRGVEEVASNEVQRHSIRLALQFLKAKR